MVEVSEKTQFVRQFADKKHGRLLGPWKQPMFDRVYQATVSAEVKHGRPVTRNEVWMEMAEPKPLAGAVWQMLMQLWCNDDLVSDYNLHKYSAKSEV